MKRIFSLFGVLLILVFALAAFAAQKDLPVKIGVFDLKKVMQEAKAAKEAREIFQSEREKKIATLNEKANKVKSTEEKLKEATPKEAPGVREELAREVKEYNRLKSDIEEELKKRDLELTQRIVNEIKKVVDNYAKNEGLSLVLEKSVVFSASDTIDITDRVIRAYDATKK